MRKSKQTCLDPCPAAGCGVDRFERENSTTKTCRTAVKKKQIKSVRFNRVKLPKNNADDCENVGSRLEDPISFQVPT